LLAFSNAGSEVWENLKAIFTDEPDALGQTWPCSFHTIYLPYLVGGILPGLGGQPCGLLGHHPVVRAYQKMRANKGTKERLEEAPHAEGCADPARGHRLKAGDDGEARDACRLRRGDANRSADMLAQALAGESDRP
jgi:hypothetical protein